MISQTRSGVEYSIEKYHTQEYYINAKRKEIYSRVLIIDDEYAWGVWNSSENAWVQMSTRYCNMMMDDMEKVEFEDAFAQNVIFNMIKELEK